MQSIFCSGSDERSTRREAWLIALAFWVAGLGLWGAAAWHAQHPRVSSLPPQPILSFTDDIATSGDSPTVRIDSTEASREADDTASGEAESTATPERQEILFMPQDVIIGRRVGPAHRVGAAQMQKR